MIIEENERVLFQVIVLQMWAGLEKRMITLALDIL